MSRPRAGVTTLDHGAAHRMERRWVLDRLRDRSPLGPSRGDPAPRGDAMTVEFERVRRGPGAVGRAARFRDRTVHQTREWLAFLQETQAAEPVVLRLVERDAPSAGSPARWSRRLGVRLLGSPLRGWTTSHMGFNLVDDRLVGSATRALADYAFGSLRCLHVEVMDRRYVRGTVPGEFLSSSLHGLELDIDRDDDTLLAGMTPHGRRDVRRSGRLGASVDEVGPGSTRPSSRSTTTGQPPRSLGRGGVPTYPPSQRRGAGPAPASRRVSAPAPVRTPSGEEPQRPGIFAGLPGGTASFTMQADLTAAPRVAWPNDLMVWEAMRRWRDRGCGAVRLRWAGALARRTGLRGKFGGRSGDDQSGSADRGSVPSSSARSARTGPRAAPAGASGRMPRAERRSACPVPEALTYTERSARSMGAGVSARGLGGGRGCRGLRPLGSEPDSDFAR